jgi:hypothetical protein
MSIGRNASRLLALAALLLILAGGFEPFYVRIFGMDRHRFGASLVELPYTKTPGLREFLAVIDWLVPRGASVAIVTPRMKWNEGYEYVYARSLYPLAGRNVLPLLTPDDRQLRNHLAKADYVAAFRSAPHIPGFTVIWRGQLGALLRRRP